MAKKTLESRYEYNQRITRLEYQSAVYEDRIQEINREIKRIYKEYDLLLKRLSYFEKALINLNALVFEIQDSKMEQILKGEGGD